MDIVSLLGILIAFMLGAYVREPFKFTHTKQEVQQDKTIDTDLAELLKEEADKEAKRQLQMYKALNWNGQKEDTHED